MLRSEDVGSEAQNKLIAALAADSLDAVALTRREHALLAYAEKLTLRPSTIVTADIEALRAVGLDDRAIHDACAIVSYFAFVNRLADGLGVEIEPHMGG